MGVDEDVYERILNFDISPLPVEPHPPPSLLKRVALVLMPGSSLLLLKDLAFRIGNNV